MHPRRKQKSSSPHKKRIGMSIEVDDDDEGDISMEHGAKQQSTLPSHISSLSWMKERQRVAEMEICCTLFECNIPFNMLRTDQWKRMVKSIAEVGPTNGYALTIRE
ncbi:hypothetical protein KP509_03G029900 [Ceratopteris richardii]|uniref:Uncharacterized protein n=1 Tax=Ceratopteris richardii TaxID=49495 RepID=A0A8T2V1E3_CERRI|nr:hypothetical protein KP509_03G029900 [Ceratopteris richardii]